MLTAPVQSAAGDRVPGDFDFLSGLQTAHIGFVDEGANQYAREIGFLQKQIAGLNKCSLLDGKGIDDAIEGGAHAGLAKCVFGGLIGGLRFGRLGLDAGGFGFGIAVFLFLLEQDDVRLGALQSVFGLADFTGGRCALLLQTAQGIEIALGQVARAAGLNQL